MFIVLSCLVQGTQYVFEEKLMHVDDVPPLVVVGMEVRNRREEGEWYYYYYCYYYYCCYYYY